MTGRPRRRAPRRRAWPLPLSAGLLLLASCAADGSGGAAAAGCEVRRRLAPLPPALRESSGLAGSRVAPGVFWTHTDSGGEEALYAVDLDGGMRAEVRVEGAENRDWEDLAVGPCGAGSCVYIADTGDNNGRRRGVEIYRVPEPDPGAPRPVRAERYPARYPEGSLDSEAMFVLPSGEIYLITKGRRQAVELYRYPLPLRADETVVLERVVGLSAAKPDEILQVTGADASPDGRWVAVRAYRSLMLFRAGELVAGRTTPALVVDLTPVGEAQGEAVTLADDGTVTLSSEGDRGPATISQLACTLPD